MLRSRKFMSSPTKKNEKETSQIMENFKHYLVNSSLHGLKYIGDTQLSLTERCFFIIAFIVVFLLSGYFISNVWQKWSETPIIIGLNPTAKSISTIPFPAVTICNMNQADLHYAKSIANGTLDEALLGSMCGSERDFRSNNSSGKWRHFKKFLLSASQPCREMLLMCRFASKLEPCMDIFWSSLTDDGLCCTFNTIHPDFMFQMASSESKWENEEINSSKGEAIDWTPEKGYPENTPSRSFPRRSIGAGYNKGLTVILNCDLKNYYCSSTSSSGFKFLIHAPMETPKLANYGFFVPPGKETRVVVTPKVNEASDLIRRVSIQQRQCVFANEWNLSYFRTYTQKNCEMECESKTIAEQCGCIMYYMPKTEADIEICSLKDVECYENIKNAIKGNASFSCSCLPACHEIEYERRSSSGPLGVGKFLIKERFLNKFAPEFVRENIAVVHIYFVSNTFHSFTKGELIGFTEFLSSTGGLLGLFMGFSVVSLIEIFYYILLKPHCFKRNQQIHTTIQTINPAFTSWKRSNSVSPVRRFFQNSHAGKNVYPYCE